MGKLRQVGNVWYLPHPRHEGTLVYGAHDAEQCQARRARGEGCALHGPSDHWAVGLPLVFIPPKRDPYTPGGMYRECEHEVLHDDPDDIAFRKSLQARGAVWTPDRDSPCKCNCCGLEGDRCKWMQRAPF